MKFFSLILALGLITSCNDKEDKLPRLQATIDSLQNKLNESYKPGFGEFMSGIQMHHAKLWFAGQTQNWPLADFEVHEIQEALEDLQKFCSDRPEVKAVGMIEAPMDSVNKAIQQKDLQSFKGSFILLTNTCNNCHKATGHAFNVVTIPASPPVVNQDFKPAKA